MALRFTALLLLLLRLLLLLARARADRVALVTSATSSAELVAARTALRSARLNAQLPPNASYVLLTSGAIASREAEAVADADAVQHVRVHTRARVLPLFDLPFDRVVYMAPYSLVVAPLAPLLACRFCAAVSRPCAFATSLLVVSPDAGTHARLLHFSQPSSNASRHCADDPHREACILNRFMPLHDAPLFPPPPRPEPPHAMRLPPAMITPHFLYYPRMRWELPSDHCGVQSIIDFSTPPFTRPTNILTLVLLPLNRQWYRYRSQLPHLSTANALSHAMLPLTFLCVMVALYLTCLRLPPPSAADPRRLFAIVASVPHDLLVVYWVAASFVLNAVCWALSVHVTQSCASLSLAVVVLLLTKLVCSSVAYAALGSVFMRFASPDDVNQPAATSNTTTHRAALTTLAFNLVEALVVTALVYTANALPAETGFRRLVWLLLCIAIYFAFWLYLVIALFWTWLAAAASALKLDKS